MTTNPAIERQRGNPQDYAAFTNRMRATINRTALNRGISGQDLAAEALNNPILMAELRYKSLRNREAELIDTQDTIDIINRFAVGEIKLES